jgi:hypothetical protein
MIESAYLYVYTHMNIMNNNVIAKLSCYTKKSNAYESNHIILLGIRRLCEVSDQVQDKISNQMFKNDF